MAQDHPGFIAKVTVLYVKIGMAYATAFHLQQGFPVLERAQGFFGNVNLMILSNNSSLHVYLLVHDEYLHSRRNTPQGLMLKRCNARCPQHNVII